jgi:hypothetical protein
LDPELQARLQNIGRKGRQGECGAAMGVGEGRRLGSRRVKRMKSGYLDWRREKKGLSLGKDMSRRKIYEERSRRQESWRRR